MTDIDKLITETTAALEAVVTLRVSAGLQVALDAIVGTPTKPRAAMRNPMKRTYTKSKAWFAAQARRRKGGK